MFEAEQRKTLAYVRVSTEHQDLDRQRDMIRRYCLAFEIEIEEWMQDEGISGRASATKGNKRKTGADMAYYAALCQDNFLTSVERPGFLRMLQAIQDGNYKRVVVAALDRLSRDMVELMLLNSKLDQWQCELIAVDAGGAMSTEDSGGWMQYAMKSMLAEHECRQTGDRTKQGIAARKAAGKMIGRPPRGWRRNDDNSGFVPDAVWWPRILVVVDLYEGGATMEEIGNMPQVPWVNSAAAVSKWLKSWELRHDDNHQATPEQCRWQGAAAGVETKTGDFVEFDESGTKSGNAAKQKEG